MTVANKFFTVLLATVALAPSLAQADSVAIASGSGNYYSARGKTQADANREALSSCNRETPQKDCALALTKAVVGVTNPKTRQTGYISSNVSVQDAKDRALKKCGSSNCKVDEVYTDPGFYTLAQSKNGPGTSLYLLGYGYLDMETAQAETVATCEARTKSKCEILGSGAIPGTVKQ